MKTIDELRVTALRCHAAQLEFKGQRATQPVIRELFLAQSSYASLQAEQIEDRLRSSRAPVPEAS